MASFKGEALDTETAFTAAALLGLVTHPANMIMTIIPQAVGSIASFERIQQYLLSPQRHDHRMRLNTAGDMLDTTLPIIHLKNVTIRETLSKPPLLTDINLSINEGSIVVCSGSVGSGKTTLARCLTGELPITSGEISVQSKSIAWCEQLPWLPIGTLKQAVCGYSPENPGWYEEVIRLCCLEDDLSVLLNGDSTVIGSRGLNLSGGQRQRVVCLFYISVLTLLHIIYIAADAIFLKISIIY